MKRQIIRLTENDLHNIIKNTINDILSENIEDERHVLKLKHDDIDDGLSSIDDESPMPPMNDNEPPMPPMGDENNDEPPMPPMNDNEPPMPPMDDENDDEPSMDNGGNDNSEIDDIFNSLGIEDQSAVLKYAKSMADNGGNEQDDDMPMESRKRLNYIIEDVLNREIRGKDRTSKRNSKDITNSKINHKNPFVTHR